MLRWTIGLLLVAGCDVSDPTVFESDGQDSARASTLTLTWRVSGDDIVLEASGASWLDEVDFVSGDSQGNGPCLAPLGGLCIDVTNPIVETADKASLSGVASVRLDAADVEGRAWQAVLSDGGRSIKSSAITVTAGSGGGAVSVTDACYPGPRGDYSACLSTVDPANPGSDYDYPSSSDWNYAAPTRYLDLNALSGNSEVAPNFQLEELAQQWKGRYAVVQVHAVEQLQSIRDRLGVIYVNSGYRSPDYNASVGGATFSRHMYGDAFDLDAGSASLSALESECRSHGAGWVGVYTSHVHCDWRDDAQEPVFFGAGSPPPPQNRGEPTARLEFDGQGFYAPADNWDCGDPLREWTAYDRRGAVIAEHTGPDFVPPEDAAEVEVAVGRWITIREAI